MAKAGAAKSSAANKPANAAPSRADADHNSAHIRPAAQLRGNRELLQQRMGQATLAALRLPRYAQVAVSYLSDLLLAPLLADRVAFAEDNREDGHDAPVGMAIWATVSPVVSEKLASQANAGVFPVKLAREDWASGDEVWLIDLLVPTRTAGTAIFMNFGKLIGDRPFRMHPIVLQSVDQEIVEKFRSIALGSGVKPLTHQQLG